MTIYFKKSFLQSKEVKEFVKKSQLDEFKRRILEHLSKQEAKEKKKDGKVQKALVEQERLNKAGYPVGTVREWKGKKYMKVAPNKWKRKYEKEKRGAKLSVAAIKRKVNACTTGEELLDIVLENRDRFKDENGQDLPIVKELMDYVSEARKKLNGGGEKGASGKAEGGQKAKGKKAAAESGKQASGEGKEEKPAVVRSPGIMKIRAKYEASPSVEGRKKTVVLPDGSEVVCHYRIVEADAPTASHDHRSFRSSEGFPTNAQGQNVNDRDYKHDEDAQREVQRIAMNYNALAIDNPPVVTKDGIVISGNNRTMSSKWAAEENKDGVYIQALRRMADEYGFEESDLAGFEHPRLILEIDKEHEGEYTTQEFAAFNYSKEKSQTVVEMAIRNSKMLDSVKIKSIADGLENYETLGNLYSDPKGCEDVVHRLVAAGVVLENETPQFFKTGKNKRMSETGKEFLETVLVGSVLSDDNIRACSMEGGLSIRQKLVRAILPLLNNKSVGEKFSFNEELNKAADIALAVARDHKRYPSVQFYFKLNPLDFGDNEEITDTIKRLAEVIHDDTQTVFANRMKLMCEEIRENAQNPGFDVRSKEEIMQEYLAFSQERVTELAKVKKSVAALSDIKKAVADALQRAFGNLGKSA